MTLTPVELIGRAKGDATDGAIPPSSRGGRARSLRLKVIANFPIFPTGF
jgi:hypothetical protein